MAAFVDQAARAVDSRFRAWVFTWFEVEKRPEEIFEGLYKYLIYQTEVCPTTGRPHLQGYIIFNNARGRRSLQRYGRTIHWEPRGGSHQAAVDYCSKAESRMQGPEYRHVERGDPPSQGKRNDLLAVKEIIDGGGDMRAVAEANFGAYVRSFRGLERYRNMVQVRSRNWFTKVHIFWGESGTGKTRRAHAEAGPDAYWVMKPNGGSFWMDGYDGQPHVVIDEFYGWITRDTLQRMIDRYPLMLPTKGGAVPFLATNIWITSNKDPKEWYPNVGLPEELRRRFYTNGSSVVHFPGGVFGGVAAEPVAPTQDVEVPIEEVDLLCREDLTIDMEDGFAPPPVDFPPTVPTWASPPGLHRCDAVVLSSPPPDVICPMQMPILLPPMSTIWNDEDAFSMLQ